MRVVAAYDNTRVLINGALSDLLQRGSFYEFIAFDGIHIETSEPTLVMQFANGSEFDETIDPEATGDRRPLHVIGGA